MTPTAGCVPGAPRIAYELAGHGPLVVFLHGIGGNRGNWRRQLEALADAYRACAWDARGYGDSDDYPGPLDFADFSADLLRLLDHLQAPRAHLCGLSMGGRIVLDFHARHPARCASLILADTFPGFDSSFTPSGRQRFIDERRQPLLAGLPLATMAAQVAPTLVAPNAAPAVVRELVDSMSALHRDSYLKTLEAMTMYAAVADLAQIRLPVQIVVGSEDRVTPPAVSRKMAAAIAGAQLCEIANAGHLSNLEQPAAFNACLREFLDAQPTLS